MSRAVVLLSGGLDSATCLALARQEGYECHALSFDYGQRHRGELRCAAAVASSLGAVSHTVYALDVGPFAGSSLTTGGDVPKDQAEPGSDGIPSTYVPARNLVFLSIATAYAETNEAQDVFIGVNAVDYSGYPDCRPDFIDAFARAATLATRRGTQGASPLRVRTPLLELSKADIVRAGAAAGVDFSLTTSCYDPADDGAGPIACGRCDACILRRRGFEAAGVHDPTRYA
ncbi:7-cyano-7-deazaguanine synthase [Leptolyngbya valderiana BDU 20041]|nr:7-cyano-7-deazaguanine synthase [Leptolyngbya valderiana BDU 20041]